MRNFLHVIVLAFLPGLFGCAHTTATAPAPAAFRVMTYNIHHAAGDDGRVDLARIAKVITDNHADLVAVQEVDVRTKRVPVDEAAELGRLTGLHVAFGKAIDFQGGAYGQAILSRFPISESRVYKLPSKPDKEQRIALAVTVSPDAGRADFRFVSTHLDHMANADRVAQANELLRVLSAVPVRPTILAGDFNATPDSSPIQAILAHFDNVSGIHPTHPADAPDIKIDYILASRPAPWIVSGAAVVAESHASDHRPAVADLMWKP